jgi:hypothetical protein
MLARRSNLLTKPPVVEKAAPRPAPVVRRPSDPFTHHERKRKTREGRWWQMSKLQREALVREIWAIGSTSIRGVARELGVTHQAIDNMARRLGLPPRNRTAGGEPA